MSAELRVVFDCNIFFQALISPSGPSGRCVALAFQQKVDLLCTATIMDELRQTASGSKARAKFTAITDTSLASLIQNIERVAIFLHSVPETFTYARDPDDAHYVNVALLAKAKYIVSRDQDLLDLMDLARPESREFRRRFPMLDIIEPQVLLREVEQAATRGQGM